MLTVTLRRGTTAENDLYTGKPGEVTIDIEKKELRIHDGVQYFCWGGAAQRLAANRGGLG